jgi:hypothetical protein
MFNFNWLAMDIEKIFGIVMFLSGVFLLVTTVLRYANGVNSFAIVSPSNPFSVEVLIGVFLIIFGLYLMKIFQKQN